MSLIEWSFHAISEIFAEMYRIVTMKSRCRDDREREGWAKRVGKWHSRIDVYQTSLSNGEPDRWKVNFGWVSIYNVFTPRRRMACLFFIPGYSFSFFILVSATPCVPGIYVSGIRHRVLWEIYWRSEIEDASREIRSNGKILSRYFSIVGLWEATWHSTFNLHSLVKKYSSFESIPVSDRFFTLLRCWESFQSTIWSRHCIQSGLKIKGWHFQVLCACVIVRQFSSIK